MSNFYDNLNISGSLNVDFTDSLSVFRVEDNKK